MEAAASGSGEVKGDEDKRWIFREQGHEPNRWSFHAEIGDALCRSVQRSFPEEEDIRWFESGKERTVYTCLNVFMISSRIRNSNQLRSIGYNQFKVPQDIGREIKTSLELLASDMIQKPSVQDLGIVAFSLTRQWLAKSILKMLKDGINTWTPPLPVGRVVIDFPSLDDKILMGSFRQHAIANTLIHMFMYSKVDVRIMPNRHHMAYTGQTSWEDSQISIKQRDGDLVISVEEKPPFILAKGDFHKFYVDLESLRRGINVEHADWIIYVTPARKQEYIDMCFTAAKLEGWIKTDMKNKWNPSFANEYPVLTYAGYRTYSTKQEELANLLDQLKARCDEVARGADAQLFGYTAEAVLNCVLMYTCLKNHRLTDCTFNSDEMVKEEGNTFVHLLQRRAEVHRITSKFRKDIDELKKTSELILEECEGHQEREERVLEFHLLEFTNVLEESLLFVSPHVMCNFLYDLSKKFKSYNDLVTMTGSVAETSRLLLCEATAVVMERCFALLGFTSKISSTYWWPIRTHDELLRRLQSSVNIPMDVHAPKDTFDFEYAQLDLIDAYFNGLRIIGDYVDSFITPCFVSVAREPCRKSRFEVFSFFPIIRESTFEKGYVFGLISVSDKYGLQSDRGYPLYEPDFPYVSLFENEWFDPAVMSRSSLVYIGGPSYHRSVPFSSSVIIRIQLDACNEKKDACFQLCDELVEIDLKKFWAERLNSKCCSVNVKGEDGSIIMYYIPIKDAVDATVEIRFKGEETYCDREVVGSIFAYYGKKFPYNCSALQLSCYKALLFAPNGTFRIPRGLLPLERSALAVPRNSSLVILVHFMDVETKDVILASREEFIPPKEEISSEIIDVKGSDCSLELKVFWK